MTSGVEYTDEEKQPGPGGSPSVRDIGELASLADRLRNAIGTDAAQRGALRRVKAWLRREHGIITSPTQPCVNSGHRAMK